MLYKVSYGNTTRKGMFNCVKTEVYDYEGSASELRSVLLPDTHKLFEVLVDQIKPIQLEYNPKQIGSQGNGVYCGDYYVDITTNIDKIATPEEVAEVKKFAEVSKDANKKVKDIAIEHYKKYLCFSSVESASIDTNYGDVIRLRIRLTHAIKQMLS